MRRVERGWIRVGMFAVNVWMSGARSDRVSLSWSATRAPGGVERNSVITARLSWCWIELDGVFVWRQGVSRQWISWCLEQRPAAGAFAL